jgi:ABC-type Fe3+/spermidine/putrescine transport system ATPase subunit
MSRIEIENLSKNFDSKNVLKELNLNINQGEMVALLGPSGCGKTTTLKIISGLLDADQGDIKFDGKSVIDLPTERRGAVLVFQEYLLFPHLNVAENIAFGLKMQGVNKDIRQKRVEDLLELVNLPGYQSRYPYELSGGQQQRIALARALAVQPKVLLLDEPISNLDANLREEMRDLIRKIHEEKNMTTIFVTHDREEALLVADKIAVMKDGNLEQVGTPEELYRNPVNRYVADFFGQANYIEISQINEDVFPADKMKEYRNKQDKILMLRPEFIHLSKYKVESNQDKLVLKGEVEKRSYAGERIYYQVRTDAVNCSLRVIDFKLSSYEEGSYVYLELPLNKAAYLEK